MKPYYEPENVKDNVELTHLCEICGKPPKAASKGTMVGWIFGSDEFRAISDRWACSCNSLTLVQSSEALANAIAQAIPSNKTPLENKSLIGTTVASRWKIESYLTAGRVGALYHARDMQDNSPVVIKVIRDELNANRRISKRILQESERAAQLAQKNICFVHDSGRLPDGHAYVVTDYVDGGNLAKKIQEEGFLDVQDVLSLAINITEALEYAHASGIIHRGIKPTNILFESSDGTTKLSDFGIAKAIPSWGADTMQLSMISDVFGDPSCMSPEQCVGGELDARSDIYSLGCVLYQALTGKPAYAAKTSFEKARAHLTSEPRPFAKAMYNCDIPAGVEAVVMRCLEKDPQDRYQSAAQLRSDLELCARGGKPVIPSPRRNKNYNRLAVDNRVAQPPALNSPAEKRTPLAALSRLANLGSATGNPTIQPKNFGVFHLRISRPAFAKQSEERENDKPSPNKMLIVGATCLVIMTMIFVVAILSIAAGNSAHRIEEQQNLQPTEVVQPKSHRESQPESHEVF